MISPATAPTAAPPAAETPDHLPVFPGAEPHTVTCDDGTRLRVYTRGEGPAVVCIHGWCGSAMGYADAAVHFVDAGYRVLVPDMRGYGQSDKPDSGPTDGGTQGVGYDAAALAGDIRAVLRHFDVDAAHVIGHDMGAPVALRFAFDFPERTLSVTYVDEPLIGFNSTPMTAFSVEAHGGFWQFGLNYAPGIPETLYTGHGEQFLRQITDLMTYSDEGLSDERIRYHALGLDTPEGVSGWVGWYRAVDRTAEQMHEIAEAGGIATPLLALAGGAGGVATVPDQMGPCAKDVRGELLDDCGHLVMEERPEAFARRVLQFFDEIA